MPSITGLKSEMRSFIVGTRTSDIGSFERSGSLPGKRGAMTVISKLSPRPGRSSVSVRTAPSHRGRKASVSMRSLRTEISQRHSREDLCAAAAVLEPGQPRPEMDAPHEGEHRDSLAPEAGERLELHREGIGDIDHQRRRVPLPEPDDGPDVEAVHVRPALQAGAERLHHPMHRPVVGMRVVHAVGEDLRRLVLQQEGAQDEERVGLLHLLGYLPLVESEEDALLVAEDARGFLGFLHSDLGGDLALLPGMALLPVGEDDRPAVLSLFRVARDGASRPEDLVIGVGAEDQDALWHGSRWADGLYIVAAGETL